MPPMGLGCGIRAGAGRARRVWAAGPVPSWHAQPPPALPPLSVPHGAAKQPQEKAASPTFLQQLQVTPWFAASPERLPCPGGRRSCHRLSRCSSRVWGSCAALGTAGRILGSSEATKPQLKGMEHLLGQASPPHSCKAALLPSSLHPPLLAFCHVLLGRESILLFLLLLPWWGSAAEGRDTQCWASCRRWAAGSLGQHHTWRGTAPAPARGPWGPTECWAWKLG